MKQKKYGKKNEDEIRNEIANNFWAVYGKNTEKLSSICRQLAFAEGAICWFFISSGEKLSFSTEIKVILLFLVLFFIFDACQYLILSLYNKAIALFYEDKVEDKTIASSHQITRPSWINSSADTCFTLKLLCIGIASFFLIGKFFFQYFLS